MPEVPHELLQQLIDLVDELREKTEGFLEQAGDQQLWYDRGYANGMLLALRDLGQAELLGERRPDDPGELGAHFAMAWGKAYRHGETMGSRETHEITGNQMQ